MQHLYRTAEDLQDQHPVYADTDPTHQIKLDPVCARCYSLMQACRCVELGEADA